MVFKKRIASALAQQCCGGLPSHFMISANGDRQKISIACHTLPIHLVLSSEIISDEGDGGGKKSASKQPIVGLDNVMQILLRLRLSLPRRCRASCAMASSTACRGSSRSSRTTFCKLPHYRSRRARLSHFMSRAIRTSCGTSRVNQR